MNLPVVTYNRLAAKREEVKYVSLETQQLRELETLERQERERERHKILDNSFTLSPSK